MRINKLRFIVILGISVSLISSCEKDNNKIDSRIYLLTNDSIKTWQLYKLIDKDSRNILPFPCIVDDEYKFVKNGHLVVSNMGTTFTKPDTLFVAPIFCKDTLPIIDTMIWSLNANQDSLIINNKNRFTTSKIIKLINDTLILKRFYNDSIQQTEYYVTKKY